MDANLDLVDRYGLPLVILCLAALGIWRVWRFVRPLVRESLEEHVLLIKELRAGTRANTGALRRRSAFAAMWHCVCIAFAPGKSLLLSRHLDRGA